MISVSDNSRAFHVVYWVWYSMCVCLCVGIEIMFTGLVEEKGRVVRKQASSSGLRLAVDAPVVSADVKIGDSVSVNGVCLTAVVVSLPVIEFDVVRETVGRSTLGDLKSGDFVNLERPLRVGDRLDGHIVLGHVDGIGRISDIRRDAKEGIFRFEAEPDVMRYIVEKGSIAVDGISLTVADLGERWFEVAVIPHTMTNTNLGNKLSGDYVNLEVDIISKYVLKYVGKNTSGSDESLMGKLADAGFLE